MPLAWELQRPPFSVALLPPCLSRWIAKACFSCRWCQSLLNGKRNLWSCVPSQVGSEDWTLLPFQGAYLHELQALFWVLRTSYTLAVLALAPGNKERQLDLSWSVFCRTANDPRTGNTSCDQVDNIRSCLLGWLSLPYICWKLFSLIMECLVLESASKVGGPPLLPCIAYIGTSSRESWMVDKTIWVNLCYASFLCCMGHVP